MALQQSVRVDDRPHQQPAFAWLALETGTVSVARANAHVTFPARVQLVAAMNPCDRVAFLIPGVPATLRQQKPELAELAGGDLGSRLRQKRRELGLLQKDAAKRLGVTADTLLNWEKNRREPSAQFRSAVAAFLGGSGDR